MNVYQILASMYGWTYEVIANMTPWQQLDALGGPGIVGLLFGSGSTRETPLGTIVGDKVMFRNAQDYAKWRATHDRMRGGK